jgi:glucose-1-phosphate thymidylyltransferase
MSTRKGIILAGGSGSRLYPSTVSISKQIIPIYDKPMIYYPLSTLMLAGIREILVISSPDHIGYFETLLKNGSQFGLNIDYAIQDSPDGLAQAFIIAEDFLSGNPSCLVLGDNIFYGAGFSNILQNASKDFENSSIFTYKVSDPQRFGVAEIDSKNRVISIEEKPGIPKSSYAVTGLYFYDSKASKYARSLSPSKRGELEITDLNNIYLETGKLKAIQLSKGYAWLDTGTPESLLDASNFIHTIEKRQGSKISCPEEIALEKGWVTKNELLESIEKINNPYNDYLRNL